MSNSPDSPLSTERGKCYAISSGAYSDYSVWCVFERREDAEAYAAAYSEMSVDEYRRRATLPSSDREALSSYSHAHVEEMQFWKAGEVPQADA